MTDKEQISTQNASSSTLKYSLRGNSRRERECGKENINSTWLVNWCHSSSIQDRVFCFRCTFFLVIYFLILTLANNSWSSFPRPRPIREEEEEEEPESTETSIEISSKRSIDRVHKFGVQLVRANCLSIFLSLSSDVDSPSYLIHFYLRFIFLLFLPPYLDLFFSPRPNPFFFFIPVFIFLRDTLFAFI